MKPTIVPTLEQVMKCYRTAAKIERMKTGRPGESTVANVLRGTENVCRSAGIALDESVAALTRRKIDAALASFLDRRLARISAWSYVGQLRGLFARWCRPYYEDAGWKIPVLDLPCFRVQPPRYVRPPEDLLQRVKRWYAAQTGAKWCAATMMLEFAMRNGDVLRLKDENFVVHKDVHYLSYVPHKTALSSGRRVFWPIHADVWTRFEQAGGWTRFDVSEETFAALNRDLRALGFAGSKAAYELRKICIDHVYQRFGVEMAVSLSGDDVRTLSRYYADPAQPNVGPFRVTDLL